MIRANSKPLVSIGISAYNEERYLAKALDSLLNQDYPNLEIIVSDNGSTDGTGAICEAHAKRNPRIRNVRNPQNIGTIPNFNRLFELAGGEYFMWAGGHDLWDPDYVTRCVDVLVNHSSAVMAQGELHEIDPLDHFVKIIPVDVSTQGLIPEQRLRKIIRDPGFWVGIYSLIHAKTLKRVMPLAGILGFDMLLTAKLGLLGEFRFVPNTRLYIRAFPQRTYRENEAALRIIPSDYARTLRGKLMCRFPTCQYFWAWCRILLRSPFSSRKKISLSLEVFGRLRASIFKELFFQWLPKGAKSALKKRFAIQEESPT